MRATGWSWAGLLESVTAWNFDRGWDWTPCWGRFSATHTHKLQETSRYHLAQFLALKTWGNINLVLQVRNSRLSWLTQSSTTKTREQLPFSWKHRKPSQVWRCMLVTPALWCWGRKTASVRLKNLEIFSQNLRKKKGQVQTCPKFNQWCFDSFEL